MRGFLIVLLSVLVAIAVAVAALSAAGSKGPTASSRAGLWGTASPREVR